MSQNFLASVSITRADTTARLASLGPLHGYGLGPAGPAPGQATSLTAEGTRHRRPSRQRQAPLGLGRCLGTPAYSLSSCRATAPCHHCAECPPACARAAPSPLPLGGRGSRSRRGLTLDGPRPLLRREGGVLNLVDQLAHAPTMRGVSRTRGKAADPHRELSPPGMPPRVAKVACGVVLSVPCSARTALPSSSGSRWSA